MLKYFKNFGTILDAKIIRDKFDGSHRGCAFLKTQVFHEAEIILKNHLPRGKDEITSKPNPDKRDRHDRKQKSRSKYEEDEVCGTKLNSRLQVRYADGELERLGIVNLDTQQEQTKLYCSHIDRYLSE